MGQEGITESNLHVCSKDDTKIAVYNMEECIERRDWNSGTILYSRKSYDKNY